ncbi:MAG TPA: SMC-Scp complex subunit ScpB [Gemmatimonadales bacterium]|nr:SMC-Scp complex subunit ScpB [Gemmatimonadales bacterium]
MDQRTRLLEAALFAAPRPLALDELAVLDADATEDDWRRALAELSDHYQTEGHGVELAEVAGGWQITTLPIFAEAIERAAFAARPAKLSGAALEVLAIVAYRQPVGRAEIEDIRGVACGGVLRMLQERGLLEVAGRSEGLGRPILYATTPLFLELVGLADLADLPRTEELAVALKPLQAEPPAGAPEPPQPAEP